MARPRAKQGGKVLDAEWRRARGRKAGQASSAAYTKRRQQDGERFASKGDAYAAGYRRGYQTAMAWWRRKYLREGLRQVGKKAA